MSSKDPLPRAYQLKHPSLRNRIMSTAHEPAYSEDGMPKDRYRRYHVERAKGGIAPRSAPTRRAETPHEMGLCHRDLVLARAREIY